MQTTQLPKEKQLNGSQSFNWMCVINKVNLNILSRITGTGSNNSALNVSLSIVPELCIYRRIKLTIK